MTASTATAKDPPPNEPGYRAAEAYIRPYPTATHGTLASFGFDLRNCVFTLSLSAPSPTPEDAPTEVFLPEWHFPQGQTSVEASGGKWTISVDDEGEGGVQMMRWWHGEGEQKVVVKGVKRKGGAAVGRGMGEIEEGEEGYLEQFQRSCGVM